jgi:sortase A
MLLKVGMTMMLFSVAVAIVIAVAVALSGGEESAQQDPSPEPLSAGTEEEKAAFDPGERVEIDEPEPREEEPSEEEPQAEPAQRPAPLPLVPQQDWPEPSGEEVAATQAPRYYPPRRDSALTLTVEAIGLYEVPVISSSDPQAMDNGVVHVPQTPLPWEERQQKNVYVAGHRLGYPGTGSRLVFYNLDKMKNGDRVALRDGQGDLYRYRVSEVFVVEPNDDWVVDPVRGRDMVTLQTCTIPDLQRRIIVRADRT